MKAVALALGALALVVYGSVVIVDTLKRARLFGA